MTWGSVVLIAQIVFWVLPGSLSLTAAYTLFAFGAILCFFCALRRRSPFPSSFPFVICLVLQLWSFSVAVYASQHLGRRIEFGRADTYLLLAIVPGVVAYTVASIAPGLRNVLMKALIAAFALSSVVAWLQFARFPGAVALSRIYTYKAIDNWDGHSGIRAVGLTAQPNYLGYQAVVGLALACAIVLICPLDRKRFALATLFTGAALFTQSRAAFLPLALVLLTILFYISKRDPKQGARISMALIVSVAVLVVFAGKRFEYMLMATSGNDASYASRTELAWAQLDPILNELPLTGIGPSPGLFLGTGPEDKWVPVGRPVESGYLLFQAMYGIPGMLIMGLGLLGSAILAYKGIVATQDPIQKQLLGVGVVICVHLAVNATSFNTFDSYIHLPLAMIIAGLAVAPSTAKSTIGVRRTSSTAREKLA